MSANGDDELARCVEHLLGVEPGAAPAQRPDLDEWLAGRGLALAPLADPAGFSMAGGFFLRRAGGWSVAFGVPPGTLFAPAGEASGEGEVLAGAVLAPLDPAALQPACRADPGRGRVVSVAIAPEAEAPMVAVSEARAVAGTGLDGDRYAREAGTFSRRGGSGRALTLVEAEALEELERAGIGLDPLASRRNLVVRGIDLDALIGRRFLVGAVECRGARRCEPCAHLERLTLPGVLRGLVHRGGLRADVLSDGAIAVGDEVVAAD